MWFSGFFFSLIVEVYLWCKLQASLIFLSGRTCTIGGWLNTFLPHCIYTHTQQGHSYHWNRTTIQLHTSATFSTSSLFRVPREACVMGTFLIPHIYNSKLPQHNLSLSCLTASSFTGALGVKGLFLDPIVDKTYSCWSGDWTENLPVKYKFVSLTSRPLLLEWRWFRKTHTTRSKLSFQE